MRYRIHAVLLVLLNLLNLLDAVFTHKYVSSGEAYEANPLMAFVISLGWGWFFVLKLSLVFFFTLIFWIGREHIVARYGTVILFVIYSLLAVYHLYAAPAIWAALR